MASPDAGRELPVYPGPYMRRRGNIHKAITQGLQVWNSQVRERGMSGILGRPRSSSAALRVDWLAQLHIDHRVLLAAEQPTGAREPKEALRPGYDAVALEQSLNFQAHGLCPSRLWNISFLYERGVPDIVPLAEIALRLPNINLDKRHKGCTPQLCELGERLDVEFELCSEISPQYMAISHVWSDGTGVGAKPAGQVNKCLYENFAKIALDLGCDGVWWDSICMPTDRKARGPGLGLDVTELKKGQNYPRSQQESGQVFLA
ncbi:uncharacterized protein LY79DRAFT_697870 [Colletotrichum navitas]|uniref:Heterokaryon incompatibility domain-containing protein n=1 Tax=Colletotrichum navitas TaxID=681940 RepID=A0AAD8UZK8_9PEZI|nr:uncharacterized protein LY79DRAFT_697870 [Colletotrichum navitas]KAK1573283.1 hypothetical protein LY79DRAFT_697870 [Colletotrichum navitas]